MTMTALAVLALATQAHAQYGLYGAPSTLPLVSPQPASQPAYPQPVSQPTYPQNPPLYVDTNTASPPLMVSPVGGAPSPQCPQPAYGNPGYGNPAYGNPAYGNPAYGNPAYANQAYANQAYASSGYGISPYPMPMQSNETVPSVLPGVTQVPYDPGYSRPIVPTSVMQTGPKPTLPPAPALAPSLPQPGAPGPITQMLNQADSVQYPVYGPSAGCGGQCGGSCDCCEPCCEPCCPCPIWFGSVAALYMGRNESNRLWTTYETGNNPNQLPTDALTEWAVGGEVSVGRCFCCGAFAVEATYWGLDTLGGYTCQSVPGGTVSTPLLVDEIAFGGNPGTDYFDSATAHFVRRRNEIHNIEISVLGSPEAACGGMGCADCGGCGCSGCCGLGGELVSLDWNFGVRHFRFEENFLFGSVASPHHFGENGGIHEAYLEDNVRNSLLGFQFGCDFNYRPFSKWRVYAAPKIGIYNNHVEHYFSLRRGDGVVAAPTAVGVTGTYPVRSTEDALSFLSEIDLGLDWQVAPNWSVFLGYRVMIATGIALADHQIPTYVVDIPEIADIDTNGDLILHGAFAGVSARF